MRVLRIFIIIFLIATFPRQSFGQKDNFVKDTVLYNDLYNFLITRVTDYTQDSLGNKEPATFLYPKNEIIITTRNLKTDSILTDKKIVGLYAARFACMDCGSDLELYFQHKDKREFITIDRKSLKPFDLIKRISLFFDKYPKEFSEIEKIRTLKGALEVLETRETRPFNDW